MNSRPASNCNSNLIDTSDHGGGGYASDDFSRSRKLREGKDIKKFENWGREDGNTRFIFYLTYFLLETSVVLIRTRDFLGSSREFSTSVMDGETAELVGYTG